MKRTFIKNQGFRYDLNNKSLLVQIITMTKPNQKLTEDLLKSLIKATSGYLEYIGKIPLTESFNGEILRNTAIEVTNKTFYKYISKETFDRFISKGSFQLGSLSYYRTTENKSSRDEKEGFSNIIIDTGDRQVFTSVLSGYDKLMLCGTFSTDSADHLRNNFGEVQMTIPNIQSFAERLKKHMGATKWELRQIQYNDFKAGLFHRKIKDLSGVSQDLSKELFEMLVTISENPSVYMKPSRFVPEMEARLVFTMDRLVDEREFYEFPELLDEIEIKTMANSKS